MPAIPTDILSDVLEDLRSELRRRGKSEGVVEAVAEDWEVDAALLARHFQTVNGISAADYARKFGEDGPRSHALFIANGLSFGLSPQSKTIDTAEGPLDLFGKTVTDRFGRRVMLISLFGNSLSFIELGSDTPREANLEERFANRDALIAALRAAS